MPLFLIALAIALLTGCAAVPPQEQPPVAPAAPVPPEIWRMADADVFAASRAARADAETYARSALSDWMDRVRERTESDFIPWYTSFGTRQWLSIKVGWYELNEPEGGATAAERLAGYLQEQYYERVLEPISREIDPQEIMEQTTALYVRDLGLGVGAIPDRYGLPQEAFRQRLERIPAIHLYTAPQQRASLYQILQARDPVSVPAYAGLLGRVEPDQEGLGSGLTRNRFYPVASASAEKLVDQLAIRGGAGIAGLAVGGVAGILISVGVSGWQAMEHEKDKPALEAELRTNLDAALDGMWRYLTQDPHGGVMAPVNHMSTQIENGLLSAQIQTGRRTERMDVF